MKIIYLILLIFILVSCTTSMNNVDRQVGFSQPPAYKQGYRDGCDSGYVAAGHPYYRFSKDVTRFRNDELYQQGWQDGFSVCKGSYDSIGR